MVIIIELTVAPVFKCRNKISLFLEKEYNKVTNN